MPEETQNGKAVVFGIRNNGSRILLTGFAAVILETAKFSHKFKLEAIEDELGFDRSLIGVNAHRELDVVFIPEGTSRAAAEAQAIKITPLSKVTLSNFAVPDIDGDWVYVGDQSLDLSHAAAKYSLKVRRYDDADQNASLVETVSS